MIKYVDYSFNLLLQVKLDEASRSGLKSGKSISRKSATSDSDSFGDSIGYITVDEFNR